MESITLTEAELQTLQAAAWDEGFIEADVQYPHFKEDRDVKNPYLGPDARKTLHLRQRPDLGEAATVGTGHDVEDVAGFLARKNGPAPLWSPPPGVSAQERLPAEELHRAAWTESLLLAAFLVDAVTSAAALQYSRAAGLQFPKPQPSAE